MYYAHLVIQVDWAARQRFCRAVNDDLKDVFFALTIGYSIFLDCLAVSFAPPQVLS
jgi:hypothetical protein